jgi:hypothetical protein
VPIHKQQVKLGWLKEPMAQFIGLGKQVYVETVRQNPGNVS